jgi:hypothetical protein
MAAGHRGGTKQDYASGPGGPFTGEDNWLDGPKDLGDVNSFFLPLVIGAASRTGIDRTPCRKPHN